MNDTFDIHRRGFLTRDELWLRFSWQNPYWPLKDKKLARKRVGSQQREQQKQRNKVWCVCEQPLPVRFKRWVWVKVRQDVRLERKIWGWQRTLFARLKSLVFIPGLWGTTEGLDLAVTEDSSFKNLLALWTVDERRLRWEIDLERLPKSRLRMRRPEQRQMRKRWTNG